MKGDSVITDRALAAFVFTLYYFSKQKFIGDRREASAAVFQNFGCKQIGEAERAEKVQWDAMTPDARQPYQIKSESHDALFPIMKDTIIVNFNKDKNMTYEHASNEIYNGCGATTICSLLEGHDVKNYADDPLQNISEDQRRQHQEFCTKATTNFYCLPANQKVLDVHFDEKWFNVYVTWRNHKSRPKLGIKKRGGTKVNHNNNIPKLMVIAVTGYVFKNGFKGGGYQD